MILADGQLATEFNHVTNDSIMLNKNSEHLGLKEHLGGQLILVPWEEDMEILHLGSSQILH